MIFRPGDWTAAFARDAVELGCVFQVGAQLLPSTALTDPGGYALSHADDTLLSVLEDICEDQRSAITEWIDALDECEELIIAVIDALNDVGALPYMIHESIRVRANWLKR
jgi:hypothetical protein